MQPLTLAGFPLSGLLYVAAYSAAYRGAAQVHLLFWLGTAVALATAGAVVARSADRRRAAVVVTALLAALLSLPKFLRAPHYFNFYDELAHWRATEALLHGGHLFAPNALNRVVADYPGLHLLTGAVAAVTGGSVFASGNEVVLVARVTGCVAAFLLAERIARTPAASLLAAMVFMANPAFMYFDAQFSYESLALPLVAVVLLLAVTLPGAGAGDRPALLVAATLVSAAVVVTHHSSSYLLIALLLLSFALSPVARRWLLALALLVAGGTLAWLLGAARYTLVYIGPYVRSNLTSIPQFLHGTNAPRRLFGGFPKIPGYERTASFLAVAVLFGLYCAGTWKLLRRDTREHRLERWLASLLGLAYFGSLPLVALRGDQVAKRTWEYAFLGLAPACALALYALGRRGRRGRLGYCAVAALLLVVFVGSGVARSGEHIRFPGPYAPSADPRSMTPEVVAAARWLYGRAGPGHRAVGDRTLAATLGSYGEQSPVTYQEDGQPIWLIFEPDTLTPRAMAEVRASGAEWIAVDLRAAGRFPLTGFYFDESEPGAYVDPRLTAQGLGKFDGAPSRSGSFRRVYDNGHVVLYQVVPG